MWMGTCESCAAELRDGDVFCGSCGAKLPQPQVGPEAEQLRGPLAVAITNRSNYERSVEHLDPLGAAYGAAAARQAFAYGIFAALASVVLFVLGARSLIGLVWFAAFLIYLFTRIPVSLSEWKTLIEGRGSQAQEVFGHVAYTLRRRQAPVDSLSVRQLSQPNHPRRDYLQVRYGILTGYVTCFPYGTDLYVGWTLWWRFSPVHYALMVAGRRWQVFTGRGTELHLLYRYDFAKAMREAMHAAVGEAVDAARGLRRLEPLPPDVPVELVQARPLIQPIGEPAGRA
jgi:hypothetical protein